MLNKLVQSDGNLVGNVALNRGGCGGIVGNEPAVLVDVGVQVPERHTDALKKLVDDQNCVLLNSGSWIIKVFQ